MQETTFIFVGVAALLTTAGTFVLGAMSEKFIDEAGAALSILLWALFGFGAMNIEKYTQCCGKITTQEPGLAFVAVGFLGLNVVILLWGVTALLDVTDATAR